eukprot:299875_1
MSDFLLKFFLVNRDTMLTIQWWQVVSLPLGDRSFFTTPTGSVAALASGLPTSIAENEALIEDSKKKIKQISYPPRNVVGGIMRRKQVSMDLMSPQQTAFFGAVEEEMEEVGEELEEKETPKMFFPLKFAHRLVRKERAAEIEEGRAAERAEVEPPPIIKATRTDKIKAIVLCCIMVAFVGVCVGWKTHADESNSVFGVVGTACVTDCMGD